MGDDKKKAVPKKEFFRNPTWWITFVVLNVVMGFLRFRFMDGQMFVLVFDVMIVLAMVLMLIELAHDRTMGDRVFDTFVLVILIWLVIRIFTEVPSQYNFLFP